MAEKNRIPYLGVAFSLLSVHKHGYRYLFSPFPKSPDLARVTFDLLDSLDPRPTRVAVFAESTDWGDELGALWRDELRGRGYQLVADERYAPGAKDYVPLIARARDGGAQVLLTLPTGPDGIALVKQMKELAFTPAASVILRAPDGATWPQNLGKDGDGAMQIVGWSASGAIPGARELARRYQERHNRPPGSIVGSAYAVVQVLADALGPRREHRPPGRSATPSPRPISPPAPSARCASIRTARGRWRRWSPSTRTASRWRCGPGGSPRGRWRTRRSRSPNGRERERARARAGDREREGRGEVAALLELDAVSRSFGGLRAVQRVSLAVEEGEILGLIGPNGAGKSTLFDLIAGASRPDAGRVRLGGEDVTRLGPHQRCRRGIARTFQLARPFPELTALANVAVGLVYGRDRVWDRRRAEAGALDLLARVGLAGRAGDRARHLTLVERKRLELARALATRPRLLLLDELLAGLNPTEVQEALALIRDLRAAGVTVLMVEHVVGAIFGLSHRVAVLNAGELIAVGAPADDRARPAGDRRLSGGGPCCLRSTTWRWPTATRGPCGTSRWGWSRARS